MPSGSWRGRTWPSLRQAPPAPKASTARIRISALSLHLFGSRGPPWVGVYWLAVLPELNIEDGARIFTTALACRRRRTHNGNRFAGKHKLAKAGVYAAHPRKEHMIPSAGVEDQELPIGPKRSGIDHPAVRRGRNPGFLAGL